MPNLTKFTQENSKTVDSLLSCLKPDSSVSSFGVSSIGHHCQRYLWYAFRECFLVDENGRQAKSDELIKTRIIGELRTTGVTVSETTENKLPHAFTTHGGHFKGIMDGCVLGVAEAPKTWHVLKAVCLADKEFKLLVKHGIKKANSLHYSETMVLMGLSKLRRTLYVATNKNTDELYSERIKYDSFEFERLKTEALAVIAAPMPPLAPRTKACENCEAKDICRPTEASATSPAFPVPALSCKQCGYAIPLMETEDALWRCTKHNRNTTPSQPCDDMLCRTGFFEDFAEPTKASPDSITFKGKDGSIWTHGKNEKEGEYSAKILNTIPISMIAHPAIKAVNEELGGVVEGFEVKMPATLLDAYPWEDSRLRWSGDQSKLEKAWSIEFLTDMKDEKPVSTSVDNNHNAAEFEDHRLAVIYSNGTAAIWKGIM